ATSASPTPVPVPPVTAAAKPVPENPASPPQVATSAAAAPALAPGRQLAAVPSAGVGADGRLAVVSFASGASELPESARMLLDQAAAEMKRDDQVRLQLIAYAAGTEATSSQA